MIPSEREKVILKFIWNLKKSQIAKLILNKKNQVVRLILPDFKTYYEAIAIKQCVTYTKKDI
jgi:hypothetical protein